MDGGFLRPAAKVASFVPARPPRDQRLDIVRGILQLSIFASHATGSFVGAWLIHGAWGISDSSEQFVFLSGFTLGSVFARKQARDGWRAAAGDLSRRIWRLYRTHLAVFALFFALMAIASLTFLPGEAARLGWSPLWRDPGEAAIGAGLMLFQPDYMGILPTFVWCMLLLPGFAWLAGRIGAYALLPSLAVYLAAWGAGYGPPSYPGDDGIAFNPFAWQFLYLAGALLGARALRQGRALDLPRALDRTLTVAAISLVLAALWIKISWHGLLPLPAPDPATSRIDWKPDLAPLRALHALALAWLVARFVPRSAGWMLSRAGVWLGRIGRMSLEVFCLGIFLSWGAATLFAQLPHLFARAVDLPVIAAGFLILGRYAAWLEHRRLARDRVAASPVVPKPAV
jgi:hypothetical protein